MNERFVFDVAIKSEEDILKARSAVRHFIMENLKFSTLDRMHTLTAVSELTRNIYKYAKEGRMIVYLLEEGIRKGIKLVFIDNGPGIPNIEEAMKPKPVTKYSVGMGLGLSGSKNLADEFDIKSQVGNGTTVTWIKWEK